METLNSNPVKICKHCKEEKSLKDFGKNSRQKDLHHYYCKECVTNFNEDSKQQKQEYFKQYRKKNKEKLKEYHKQYRTLNRKQEPNDAVDEEAKKQKKRDKEKQRRSTDNYKVNRSFYFKMKYQNDVQYRLKKQFESKLNRLLKENVQSEIAVRLIGCTIAFFKEYLSSLWLPTMSWDNYGIEWNLDRKIPFCDFNLSNEEEAARCFHYSNVQPMFIQTKIIDGVEYIGNMNKNKFFEEKSLAKDV